MRCSTADHFKKAFIKRCPDFGIETRVPRKWRGHEFQLAFFIPFPVEQVRGEHFAFAAKHGVEPCQRNGCHAVLALADGDTDGFSGVPFFFLAAEFRLPFPAGNA